jgi:hypothetical protein
MKFAGIKAKIGDNERTAAYSIREEVSRAGLGMTINQTP